MDPMEAPVLVVRNLEKYLDDKSKKVARLVNTSWKQKIEEEGELRIMVYPVEEGNWEFVKRIRRPLSLCFLSKPEEDDEKPSFLSEAMPLKIQIMCESDFPLLKKQLFPHSRSILTELIFSGNFLWRSELMSSTQDLLGYEGERCFLPSLKTLRFSADARPNKISHQWNLDYNSWGSAFRLRAQRNIHFILNILFVPSLKTYISESVCSFSDNNMKNIKSLAGFFDEFSSSLKTVRMSSQRSDVLRNYKEDAAIPKLEELLILLFDIEVGLEMKVFNTKGYWGKFLKAQSILKKIRWEYLAFVPQDFVYSVISSNQNTLEEFIFSCAEHNTRMVIIEPNVKVFNCAVLSGCHHLKKLSLSFDWELVNIDRLPKNIEILIFQGCLMTYETLSQLNLPKVKTLEMSRNIFSTGTMAYYEISENTVKFLVSIRSLSSLFIEKLKDDSSGADSLEDFFKNFRGINVPIPEDKFFPDHFVSLKL